MEVTEAASLESFFDPHLQQALSQTGVEADAEVRYYLVTLLARQGEIPAPKHTTLVELESAARCGDRRARCRSLRRLGDHALWTSGLFAERLRKRGISARYYRDKGGSAYAEAAAMAARGHGAHAQALDALSRRFDDYVRVLRHVREHTALSAPRDAVGLLRQSPRLRGRVWNPRDEGSVH